MVEPKKSAACLQFTLKKIRAQSANDKQRACIPPYTYGTDKLDPSERLTAQTETEPARTATGARTIAHVAFCQTIAAAVELVPKKTETISVPLPSKLPMTVTRLPPTTDPPEGTMPVIVPVESKHTVVTVHKGSRVPSW